MAWHRPGYKAIMVSLLMHIYASFGLNELKENLGLFAYWKWIYASIYDGLGTEGKTYEKLCDISQKQPLNLP